MGNLARIEPTPEMNELLKRSGSNDYQIAVPAQRELARALTLPLKQGVLNGSIAGNIFEPVRFGPGAAIEFPLDWLTPQNVKEFRAYTIPNTGRIPEKAIEGDYVTVSTYLVGASLDWNLRYARDARWDVVSRAMEVAESMFNVKDNDDAFHTLLAAGVSRNFVVYDNQATAGLFTKRLVSLMKTQMRRSAGGNSASLGFGRLTDLYMSPESLEDIRSWDLTQIDDVTRREIMMMGDTKEMVLYGVRLHDIYELGVNQDYQNYFTTALGGTLPSDKQEIVIGLDLTNRDAFVNPIREDVDMYEDPTFHRQRRASIYGWKEHGFAALSNMRIILGAV